MDEAKALVTRLLAEGKSLATAESCTGGLLGKLLTDVPGSSQVYLGGVISYCNEVKTALLGVDAQLLEEKGAVCPEVALQMAQGVRRLMKTDYAISVTGVAGPGGDDRGNPQGLVYGAVLGEAISQVIRMQLPGDRIQVREAAAAGLFGCLLELSGKADSNN